MLNTVGVAKMISVQIFLLLILERRGIDNARMLCDF